MVNATSAEALYSLLDAALEAGKTELAVRIGYWREESWERVEEIVAQVREEQGLMETPAWVVNYYPAEGPVGLIEFLMDAPETPEEPETEDELPLEGQEEGALEEAEEKTEEKTEKNEIDA